jgi:hypothetical protein
MEEFMAYHGKSEATFGEGDTSKLRPIKFKVQIFVGTIFMRPEIQSSVKNM